MKRSYIAKSVFAVCAVMVLSTPVLAERNGKWVDQKIERLQAKLELTDDQANQIAEIFSQMKKDNKRCNSLNKFSERRDCRQAKHDEKVKKVQSVLNDKQKTQFEEMRKNWKGDKGMPCGHNCGGGSCDKA
ncbi:MAG: hypothetical protein IT291_00970 [Deltaproteobacteria bacterium]|nr:hypothetical protein [Deltaproteobacteria bacterium]